MNKVRKNLRTSELEAEGNLNPNGRFVSDRALGRIGNHMVPDTSITCKARGKKKKKKKKEDAAQRSGAHLPLFPLRIF